MTNKVYEKLRRGLSLLVAIVMLVTCMGLGAIAEEAADDVVSAPVDAEVYDIEDVSLGDEGHEDELPMMEAEEIPDVLLEAEGDSENSDDTAWRDLQRQFDAASDGDIIQLTQDVYARDNDSTLAIRKGITLDLAGFSINRGLYEGSKKYGSVLAVYSSKEVTLMNSVSGSSSVITGGYTNVGDGGGIYNAGKLNIVSGGDNGEVAIVGNYSQRGGAIFNAQKGELVLRGARLADNTAVSGGGIFSMGKVTVRSATITHNTASYRGGGIYNAGELDMRGGVISYNAATGDFGGGVMNNNNGVMTMSGGSIHHNNAVSGGGIFTWKSLTLSGNASITNNGANKLGAGITFYEGELTIAGGDVVVTKNMVMAQPRNLFITGSKTIKVTGKMGSKANIGVYLQAGEGPITSGASASGNVLDNKNWAGFSGDGYGLRTYKSGWNDTDLYLYGKKGKQAASQPFMTQNEKLVPVDKVNSYNWMGAIPDDRYLYEINSVYSHDANTYNIAKHRVWGDSAELLETWYKYAICQYESLKEQMDDGVRLFDIRLCNKHCKYRKDDLWGSWVWGTEGDKDLYITHGKKWTGTFFCRYDNRDLRLTKILEWVKDFLRENPTETIMLSFTAEAQDLDKNHDFIFNYLRYQLENLANTINPSTGESYLYREPGSWSPFDRYTHFPKLGDCRGKVFIMVDEERELSSVGSMISTPSFAPTRQGQPGNNQVLAKEKIKNVQKFLDEKINVPNAVMLPKHGEHLDVWYWMSLNSHTEDWTDYVKFDNTPMEILKEVNPTFFGEGKAFDQKGKYVGWVKMDGVTVNNAKYVWQSNFPDDYDEQCKITVKSGLDPDRVPLADYTYTDQDYIVWYNDEVTVPDNIYTVDATFKGWKVTMGDQVFYCKPNHHLTITADTTIEGVWEYEAGSSVMVLLEMGEDVITSFVDEGSTIDLSQAEQITRDGYTLTGFTADGVTRWDADKVVTENDFDIDINGDKITTLPNENDTVYKILTLSPIWEATEATVIFERGTHGVTAPKSSTIQLEQTMTFPADPVADNERYIFDGWVLKDDPTKRYAAGQTYVFNDWTCITGTYEDPQLVFEATWRTRQGNVLTFDSASGTIVDAIDAEAGQKINEPAAPTSVGRTFVGWFDKSGDSVTWPYTMPDHDETLTAKWTANTYTVTYVTPEDATQITPVSVPYGANLEDYRVDDPVRPHYYLYDWVPQLPETMPAHDLTVTAHWRRYEYTVEFDANGGKWVEEDGSEKKSRDFTGYYGTEIPNVPNPTWEGHFFSGWTVDSYYTTEYGIIPGDSNTLVDVPDTIPDISTRYIAQWSDQMWSEPQYELADDFSSVTATRYSYKDESQVESETVAFTAEVTKEASCTEHGITTYTAVFTNPAFETLQITNMNIMPTGHDWGEWEVTEPATEDSYGQETCVCKNNPEHTLTRAIGMKWNAASADFTTPFTNIQDEAYMGISATHVEIPNTVTRIGARAFANCANLRRIHIPASVVDVDDTALEGCSNVVIYGGSEAMRIAVLYGFSYLAE